MEACGSVNATINGQRLATDGSLTLQLDPEGDEASSSDTRVMLGGHWTSECLTANDDQSREQRLQLRVTSLDGEDLTREDSDSDSDSDSSDLTIRFRQTAPVRIIDIEGAASAFRFGEAPALIGSGDGTDAAADLDAAELAAWRQSLAAMHQNALLIQHDIHAREQYMRLRFGASSVKLACSDRSFLGSLFHRISSLIGKSGSDDDGIRVQDSTISTSWEQMYPPHEPPVCGSNDTRVGPPPPPPAPPPFLLRCTPPASSEGMNLDLDESSSGKEDSSSEGSDNTGKESHSSTGDVGSDGEAQTDSLTIWPGRKKIHSHNYRVCGPLPPPRLLSLASLGTRS